VSADGSHLIFRNATQSSLSTVTERDGQACYIVRPLDRSEVDAEVGPMYSIEFDDGIRLTAYAEELFLP